MDKKNLGQKLLYSPFTKIIIAIVVFLCIYIIRDLIRDLLMDVDINGNIKHLIRGIFIASITIISYSLLYKFFEKRIFTDFFIKGIGKNLLIGLTLGVVIQSLIILVMYLKGGYTVISINPNPFEFIIPALMLPLTSSILEETLFRGFIFRIIEEKLGSYNAMLISGLLFGIVHYSDLNCSLIEALLIVIPGLLLAVAYMYSRNLWFPIAIHFAWNFTQDYIYGVYETGGSLIISKLEGSKWLTGGVGVEGTIQAFIFSLITIIILLILCHKKGKIIKPYWKKTTNR